MRHLFFLGIALALSLAAQAQSVSVRVVDAATGAAVKGADVRAVVVKHVEERRRERIPLSEIGEWEAEREATKLRAVSDASGAATLDFSAIGVPESYVLLSARSGEQWGGRVIVGTGEGEVELRLEPDFSFDVHVFDASGKPAAGVPVAYSNAQPKRMRGPMRMYAAVVNSDASGVARFPHAQVVLRSTSNTGMVVLAAVPTADSVELAFDATQRPLPKAELHLPPCGSVILRFDANAGRQVRLRKAIREELGANFWLSECPWRVAVRDGVALFPYVEPGLELEYQVDRPDVMEPKTERILGPLFPGERLVVTPSERPEPRGVIVQLVDKRSVPLRDRELFMDLYSHLRTEKSSSGGVRSSDETTDATGRLEILLPDESAGVIELRLRIDGVGSWVGVVPALANGKILNLGSVVLAAVDDAELLAAFDDDGLEREFERIAEVAKVDSVENCRLECVALEMARRGGERWIAFLQRQLEQGRKAEAERRYAEVTLDELSWLIALRRAQRRPDPCRLVIHAADLEQESFALPVTLRVALQNVDSEESFSVSSIATDHILATFEPNEAGVTPKSVWEPIYGGGASSRTRLRPGQSSARSSGRGSWQLDLSRRFELTDGDWRLRLEYGPSFNYQHRTAPVGIKIAAEPFVLRVREPKK